MYYLTLASLIVLVALIIFTLLIAKTAMLKRDFDWVSNEPSEDIWAVGKSGAYFHVNARFEPLYPFRFEWVDNFHGEVALVVHNGAIFRINKAGERL